MALGEAAEELRPQLAVTGHGLPMEGEELTVQLQRLAREFDKLAIPAQGRYVPSGIEPARMRKRAIRQAVSGLPDRPSYVCYITAALGLLS